MVIYTAKLCVGLISSRMENFMERSLYLRLFFFLFVLSTTPSFAQLTITSNDTTICTGNSVTLNASHQARTPIPIAVIDDQYTGVLTIGFPFTFYGNTYSQCVVSSNGYISFNTANAGAFSPFQITTAIPGNVATYNSILAAYADWDPSVGGTIDYATVGTAPNRKFVVTFCALPLYSFSCNSLLGTFQVIMYETSNIIDIHLGRKPVCPTSNGGASIEGIQNSNGTAAMTIGTGSSARNYPFQWTAYHSSHRFTPTTTAATAYTLSTIPYGRIPDINIPYNWYLNNSTAVGTASAPSITVSPTTTSFYTVRKIDCSDTLSDTVVVTVVNPIISSTAFTNTTCGNNNGSITLNGLSPNTVYTVTYTSGTVQSVTLTSSATGSIVLTNLPAGTYSNISVNTAPGCTSPAVGPITLVAISPVITSTSFTNPTTCGGTNGTITLNGLTANTSYTVNYNNPTSQTQTVVANASGSVIITGLSAGTYSGITVAIPGCTSAAVGPITLNGPAPPVISTTSFISPTTCGGSNGSITLNGLAANTSYTVNYTSGTAQTQTITSNSGGSVVITGLAAGTYSGITVSANTCTSSAVGPITLINPPTPIISTVTSINPTTCGGTNGSITLNGLTANTTYTVNYSTGTAQTANITANATGSVVISNLPAGTYSNITVTLNGCTSTSVGPINLTNPPTPVISSTSFVNLSTCGGTNGSITLNGLAPSTSYTLSYTSGTVQTQAITTNASGSYTLGSLGAGTYSNITVTINSCTSTAVGPVILSNPPTPVIATTSSANPTTCGGTNGSITLTGLTANTTYSVSYTFGTAQTVSLTSSASGTIVIGNLGAGTYSNITVTLNNCASAAAGPITLSNPSTPVITSTSFTNPSNCGGSNGSVTLNGLTPGATYTVNFMAGTAQTQTHIANAAGSIVVNNLTAGTYSNFTVTINGCTSGAVGPFTLTNPANPVITSTSFTNPTTCGGSNGTISLNGLAPNTGYTVNYTSTSPQTQTTTANASGTVVISNLPAGTYSSITVISNSCTSSAVGPITLTSPSTPVISSTSSANPATCGGTTGTITLNGLSANTSYTVNYNSGTPQTQTIISNASGSVVITGLGAGTYSAITVTANGCTSAPVGPISLSSPTSSAPVVAPGPTYCEGQAASALTATGQNLLWYTLPVGGTGQSAAPVPSTTSAGIFTWYVSQTVNNCESPRSAITVTVIAKPSPPFVISNTFYCEGETATTLTATGQNIKWYTTATGGSGSSTAPTPSTATAGTSTWYVSQTVNGCESDRASMTVTVKPKPALPVVASPIFYCEGDTASPLTASGQNLLWYPNSVGGVGSTSAPMPNTSLAGTATFYVTQTINGCEGNRAGITVIVNDKVNADVVMSRSTICQFDTITITNNGSNPSSATYNWNFDGGVIITGSGAGPYQVTWNSLGTKVITLNISNTSCTDADTKQVIVRPAPVTDFVLKEDACIDEIITVQAAWNSLNNTNYTWDFGDATVINGSGPGAYKIKWATGGDKLVSLITSAGGCESHPLLDTITIHEHPAAKIEVINSAPICAGDQIILQAAPLNNGEKYTYLWSPQEFFTINGVSQVAGNIKRSGLIYLQVIDAYGCKGTDSTMITADACCDVFLPDAFTPNADGRNDVFHALGKGNHFVLSFRIVNRWGQTVFESADVKAGWDGTLGGVAQPMDTYFYYLKYECGTKEIIEKKGELTLIR
jgi:gliding motility-associated-like protein